MPQTTPDILKAAIKCFHLNTGQIFPEFVVIYSPHAALFAVTSRASQVLRQNSPLLTDWSICLDLPPTYQLQLMGISPPPNNNLAPASASTFAAIHQEQPARPEDPADPIETNNPYRSALKFSSPPEENPDASDPQNL